MENLFSASAKKMDSVTSYLVYDFFKNRNTKTKKRKDALKKDVPNPKVKYDGDGVDDSGCDYKFKKNSKETIGILFSGFKK